MKPIREASAIPFSTGAISLCSIGTPASMAKDHASAEREIVPIRHARLNNPSKFPAKADNCRL